MQNYEYDLQCIGKQQVPFNSKHERLIFYKKKKKKKGGYLKINLQETRDCGGIS